MSVSFFYRQNAPALAYKYRPPKAPTLPTIVFLTGFCSDMEGTKATYLSAVAEALGAGYLRFDYTAHGQSGGIFEDCTIGTWKKDSLDMIDSLTTGPLVIVGSSMGGWLGLLVCLERPEIIKAFIGLAAAPDFTRDIPHDMNDEQKKLMAEAGSFPLPNDYGKPYRITRQLLEEGEKHCLFPGPIGIECPVRLLQGKKDTDVPPETAEKLFQALKGEDKQLFLLDNADHRLSTPEDLALLQEQVRLLIGRF